MLRVDDIHDLDTAKQVATLAIKENERLHTRLAELTKENAGLKGESDAEQLELELVRLKEQMAALQKRLFAASSERRPRPKGDGVLDAPRPTGGLREQKKLAIEEVVWDLPAEEMACDCCGRSREEWTGQAEETEEVDVVERQFVLKKHKRTKYRCRCGAAPVTAPGPLRMPGGGRYSLDFAIAVVDAKYHQHLPLERQVRTMRTEGLDVTATTLWEQTERLARLLKPAYEELREHILKSPVIHADETPWPMLKKGHKKHWVWSVSTHDAVYHRINKSRAHQVFVDLVDGYDGTIVADGYRAYGTAAEALDGKIEVSTCWSHARRKFVEAEESYPQAERALEIMGELFLIERDFPNWQVIEDDALRAAALAKIREEREARSRPLVEALRKWAGEQRVLPKSKLGEALAYLNVYWDGLAMFLDDPRIPMTNNAAERSLRGVVLGRKNHYGSKSVRGTEVAALFYSLIESAKLRGAEPKAFLREAATLAVPHRGDHLAKEPQLDASKHLDIAAR